MTAQALAGLRPAPFAERTFEAEDRRITDALARSAAHDAACLKAVEELAEIRAPALSSQGTALPALRASAAPRRVFAEWHRMARPSLVERCDYCGCSRHACGCEARFEYEEIRDNPQLIAR